MDTEIKKVLKPVNRQEKEKLLQQKGVVLWLTGLSGAGKSTLATNLECHLHKAGFSTAILDGDHLRNGLNAGLGFTDADRTENIRRAAEVARLMVENGLITICSFISPTHQIRQLAKQIIGPDDFYEIFVDCSFETCAQRDVKGLYKKALNGEIKQFTGLDSPFEKPEQPWLTINTEQTNLTDSIKKFTEAVLPLVDHYINIPTT